MERTFTYREIPTDALRGADLAATATEHADAVAYSVTIYADSGEQEGQPAGALYLPSERRIGIEWGADADWGDVYGNTHAAREQAITDWLNDAEAWAGRN